MGVRRRACLVGLWLAMAGAFPGLVVAQAGQQPIAASSQKTLSPAEAAATQQRLLEILHVSPTMAGVLANDPTLLANPEYIAKSDPELAGFLGQHPEVARNPAFYLFSDLRTEGNNRFEPIEQHEGIVQRPQRSRDDSGRFFGEFLLPIFIIGTISTAIVVLCRLVLHNRRWSRAFKLQSEVHGQLIGRFGSSEELITYMQTEAGRRFLEAAPITVEEKGGKLPNVASRVLLNAQIGVVMMLLGIGMLLVRNHTGEGGSAMLVLGVLVLMPGVGFILSAAMTMVLARRLGLMTPGAAPDGAAVPR